MNYKSTHKNNVYSRSHPAGAIKEFLNNSTNKIHFDMYMNYDDLPIILIEKYNSQQSS